VTYIAVNLNLRRNTGRRKQNQKNMKPIFKVAILFVALFITSTVRAQLVKDDLTKMSFSDQYDEDKGFWRSVSSADNLFVIQDGEYMLRRKNPASGYSIFTSWKNTLPAYSLTASMKLEEIKNDDASVGLIFMAQADGSGAFVFEFNQKGQYRLKQLVGINFKLLTGDIKTNGWVNTQKLNPVNQYNQIEVRTSKRNYDIYLNHDYLLSFTEPAYKIGDIGIALGPGTKARVDFITVYEPADAIVKATPPANNSNTASTKNDAPSNPSPTKKDDAASSTGGSSDMMMKLVEQITKLSVENQQLRDSLNICKKKK
jgi:hypothetical protein